MKHRHPFPVSRYLMLIVLIGLCVAVSARNEPAGSSSDVPPPPGLTIEILESLDSLPGDLGELPGLPVPADNPMTDKKIELGMMLFFDKRLSQDGSTSCASCHDPAKGYSDGLPRARGFGGQELGRHSPTLLNVAYNEPQFWDGRVNGLEDQAIAPIMAEGEMNMESPEELIRRVANAPEYEGRFNEVFGQPISMETISKAIASFERTLVTPNSPFDRYVRGEKDAMSAEAKRGLALFVGKASCTQCHSGPNFTDNEYHNIGVDQRGPLVEDLGRFEMTGDEADRGAFKTPTLRNVAITAPYMHDGSIWTLEEVVEVYNHGGGKSENQSELIFELGLTPEEKTHLVAFLEELTGEQPSLPEIYGSGSERDEDFKTVAALMTGGIHEDFTLLSFTIWHDRPLTDAKRDTIAVAADNIARLAATLHDFQNTPVVRKDPAGFAAGAARLAEAAITIRSHAVKKDAETLSGDFVELEAACSQCHAVFQEALELK